MPLLPACACLHLILVPCRSSPFFQIRTSCVCCVDTRRWRRSRQSRPPRRPPPRGRGWSRLRRRPGEQGQLQRRRRQLLRRRQRHQQREHAPSGSLSWRMKRTTGRLTWQLSPAPLVPPRSRPRGLSLPQRPPPAACGGCTTSSSSRRRRCDRSCQRCGQHTRQGQQAAAHSTWVVAEAALLLCSALPLPPPLLAALGSGRGRQQRRRGLASLRCRSEQARRRLRRH